MPWRIGVACLLYAIGTVARPQALDRGTLSWSGLVGAASGLVYRGIDLNEEVLVPNLDIAVEHDSGFYLHGWLTRVDLPQREYDYTGTGTLWQTLLDVGYTWRVSPALTTTLAHGWYRYSDEWYDREPDYREWMVTVDYRNLLVLDYARTDRLWGLDEQQDALSLGIHWSFNPRLVGAATVGWIHQDGLYADDYRYLRLNLGYLIRGDWSIQLQFHDSFGIGDVYHEAGAKREWVGQLSWHW